MPVRCEQLIDELKFPSLATVWPPKRRMDDYIMSQDLSGQGHKKDLWRRGQMNKYAKLG